MNDVKTVYVTWQAPDTHSWHVVGRLQQIRDEYTFNYTTGALAAEKFIPFSGMEALEATYHSDTLFPLFKNRVLSVKRPEYPRFLSWLGLDEDVSAIDVLARSGGMRSTDNIQIFKKLDIAVDGSFTYIIFVHGISHLGDSARKRVSKLEKGESLYLCLDLQNRFDENAIIVRAENPAEIVGYCPRYLAADLCKILKSNDSTVQVTVEAFAEDAPANYQLMCTLQGKVSVELRRDIMNENEYTPLTAQPVPWNPQ